MSYTHSTFKSICSGMFDYCDFLTKYNLHLFGLWEDEDEYDYEYDYVNENNYIINQELIIVDQPFKIKQD